MEIESLSIDEHLRDEDNGPETLRYTDSDVCVQVDNDGSQEQNSSCSIPSSSDSDSARCISIAEYDFCNANQDLGDYCLQMVPLLEINNSSSTSTIDSCSSKLFIILADQRRHAFQEWISAKKYVLLPKEYFG